MPSPVRFMVLSAALVATAAWPAAQQMTLPPGGGGGGAVFTSMTTAGPGGAALPPLVTGTGLIYGQVTDGTTSRPVGGVLVTLGVPGFAPVRVIADGEGRFTFRDIPKGRFSLTATMPGFGDGAYGRLHPGGSSQPIDLADGQQMTEATIPVWKLGVIAGTVLDDSGDPIVGAPIGVLKRSFAGGQVQLVPSGTSVLTDDRGVYRIGGLDAGTYVVVLPITQERHDPPVPSAPVPATPYGPAPPPPPLGRFGAVGSGGLSGQAIQTYDGSGMQTGWQSVNGSAGSAPARVTTDGQMLWYQTTFYPNALAASRSTPVTIAPGEVQGGIDLTLKPVRASSVSGLLTGPEGPVLGMVLTLFPADADSLIAPVETATASTDATGHFEFPQVPVGQYTVRAFRQPRAASAQVMQTMMIATANGNAVMMRTIAPSGPVTVPPLPTDPTLWMESNLSVGVTDLTGVSLGLRTGMRATGHVVFDGSASQPTSDQLPTISLALDAADARTASLARTTAGRIDSTGQFTTLGVAPGRYVLRVGPPSGWTLRSAIYEGRDIVDQPVEIGGADLDGITVTFTDKTTGLTGTVASGTGVPDPKASVVIFPADPSQWAAGPSPRRLKNIRAGQDGSFSVSVPAGDYLVVALNDVDDATWNDPAVLAVLSRVATSVTLTEGQKPAIPLRTTTTPKLAGGGQ